MTGCVYIIVGSSLLSELKTCGKEGRKNQRKDNYVELETDLFLLSDFSLLAPTDVANLLNPIHDGDQGLQLFHLNEEFPVSAGPKFTFIQALPLLLIALQHYRLDVWWGTGISPPGLALPLAEHERVLQTPWNSWHPTS